MSVLVQLWFCLSMYKICKPTFPMLLFVFIFILFIPDSSHCLIERSYSRSSGNIIIHSRSSHNYVLFYSFKIPAALLKKVC